MEYLSIGQRGLRASRIGLGCEILGATDWGHVDVSAASEAVRHAEAAGVTVFDTADVYGIGRSEIELKTALGERRFSVVVATKFGVNWRARGTDRAETFYDASPSRVRDALDESLRRLGLDCVPLYYVHWPDPKTPIEKTMEALARCRDEGKILEIGVSNFSVDLIRRAHAILPLAVVQGEYSLLNRNSEKELIPCCREFGIRFFGYGPLAQGLLTGKYDRSTQFSAQDRRHRLPYFGAGQLETNLKKVDALKSVAMQLSKTPAQVALRWVLQKNSKGGIVVGARSPDQVSANLGALGWELTTDEMALLAHQFA